MIAELPQPKPAASLDEWQGMAALLALREERRLRALAILAPKPQAEEPQPVSVEPLEIIAQ